MGDENGKYFYELWWTWIITPRFCIMISKGKRIAFDELHANAPIIRVRVKSIQLYRDKDSIENLSEKFVVINAMIDTGAPNSFIDASILNKGIEMAKTGAKAKIGFYSDVIEDIPIYKVGIDLSNNENLNDVDSCIDTYVGLMNFYSRFDIMGTPVEMLIGRDILSRCIFTYNGVKNIYSLDHKI